MERHEFTNELSAKAIDVYSNSSYVFYVDADGEYYAAYNSAENPFRIGTLEDVEAFLLEDAEA